LKDKLDIVNREIDDI